MKRYFQIILLAMIFAGCNDWLEVSPREQTKEDELYEIEDGFKSALTGIYLQMGSVSLYGRNTTMDIPDLLAQYWTTPNATKSASRNQFARWDMESSAAESVIRTVWLAYYKSIAQLNNILYNLENTTVNFSYGNDDLIKGEALGLRAFMHFDVLRFFGPVPGKAQPGDITIPYVSEYTRDVDLLSSKSWQAVVLSIEKDLDAAEEALQNDPILFYSNNALKNYLGENNKPVDSWQFYRQNRFNYYAVLGTKARFYHWIGDKDKAVYYAKQVVGAMETDGSSGETGSLRFVLVGEAYYDSSVEKDLVMFQENMFGLHNSTHKSSVQSLFVSESPHLTQTTGYVASAYESNLHPDDMRNKPERYWREETYINSNKVNQFLKYTGNITDFSGKNATLNTIPLLRLAEMYFILIENCPLTEAREYFNTYRIARGLSSFVDDELIDATAASSNLEQRLEKEYRKEFWGEGQMFFFYKKHEYETYTWPIIFKLPAALDSYLIPKPKDQIDYENYD